VSIPSSLMLAFPKLGGVPISANIKGFPSGSISLAKIAMLMGVSVLVLAKSFVPIRWGG